MTVILLVRHAVTDATGKRLYGRLPGVHLSDRGRDQALAVAGRLAGLPIDAVYSSPLERCLETAKPIASAHGLSVERLAGVQEIDYGRWTGRPFTRLARTRLWGRFHSGSPSSVRFPDGETLAEAQRRGIEALDRIVSEHPRAVVVVVSHGDMVALALAHFAGIHIDLFQRVEVAPASVSAISVRDGVPRIFRLNDTGTLDDLVPHRRTRPR